MKITRVIALLGMLLALTTLTGCVLLGYNRTDNFVSTPVLSWRGGSSLRPGQEEGMATGFHFVPYKGLSMHNYKVIAPVAFTNDFSFIMEFELDCKPSGADDGHSDGFFVFMLSILKVPCLGDDYVMPAACPPPTELAFLFARNNPVEKPTEPHLAVLFKGQTVIERTTSTGIIMDGMNKLYINKVGNAISIMINDRKYEEFYLELLPGEIVTVDVTADSGHYESELPPDDEGNPRMPSDVLYFRKFILSGTSGGSFYVPESFYFEHLNEL
jgi:hypothetical protein